MKASDVFKGSDGDLTKRYYADLMRRGPIGIVAMNLFRAQKCSTRAKAYRGRIRGVGSYKEMAYDRKGWSLKNLCTVLGVHAENLRIIYGWGRDDGQTMNSYVLYVDLPYLGQVSFHSPERFDGPGYVGNWDGQRASEERILAFCDRVYSMDSGSLSGVLL